MHPGWTGTGLTFPDLALLRSERDFAFVREGKSAVLPICLPFQGCLFKIRIIWIKHFYGKPIVGLDVHGHKGYVAGWGLTRNAECFTDNFGPERHARCRFPFIFNGNLNVVM